MALPRIVWHRVGQRAGATRTGRPQGAAPSQSLSTDTERLATAVAQYGVPRVEGATCPKEDAVGLLMLAAEVEHALMVQYLYAAQSVRGVASRVISHIAVQEMGHLVTVQNLLLSLEGLNEDDLPARLHLGRDVLRRTSTHNPLPLVLEPVSRSALAKFVVIERPATILDDSLRVRVEGLEAEVAAEGVTPNPVYALYAAIRWIFQAGDDDPAGLAALGFKPGWHLACTDFADPIAIKPFLAEPIEWGAVPGLIVMPVDGRRAALVAIDAITAQGEGTPGMEESHFQDFLDVLDSFEAGQIAVTPLPRTPFTASQPAPEDDKATLIVNLYTTLWAQLFDAAYELLITDIGWSLSQPRTALARPQLIDVCIDSMKSLAQPMASHLAKRPLGTNPQQKAGPPYGLRREDLPTTIQGFDQRYRAIIGERNKLIDAIQSASEFANDLSGKLILTSIAEIDEQRAPHLP